MIKVYEVADYVTINISSPNTPRLRNLEKKNVRILPKMTKQTRDELAPSGMCDTQMGPHNEPLNLCYTEQGTREQKGEIIK